MFLKLLISLYNLIMLLLILLIFAPFIFTVLYYVVGFYLLRNKKYTQQEIDDITMLGAVSNINDTNNNE